MSVSALELREKMRGEAKSALRILDEAKSAGREPTTAEFEAAEAHAKSARDFRARAETVESDERVKARIAQIGDGLGTDAAGWRPPVGRQAKSWVSAVRDKIDRSRGGQKAIINGTFPAPALITPDIVVDPHPRRLIDLLVNRRPIMSANTFNFLRQTARTTNAAPVPDATEKPVSTYEVTEIEDRVRVLAHLSNPYPNRYFADVPQLERFLESEMYEGLLEAVEDQIVNGDGTGENLPGLLVTSGLVTQAFNTDVAVTLRKARTALQVRSEVPTGYVLHPTDAENVDLLRAGTGGPFLLSEPSTAPVLGGVPVVVSTSVPAGTGILADWTQMQVIVRQDAEVQIDTSGELFRKNLSQWRVEGRWGIAVLRPGACCKIALTA